MVILRTYLIKEANVPSVLEAEQWKERCNRNELQMSFLILLHTTTAIKLKILGTINNEESEI